MTRPHRETVALTSHAVTALNPPRHVAIIMDGNNRWAKQRGLPGPAGHRAGAESIRRVMDACGRFGVEVLTLFAFSSENWHRPAREVRALMGLFAVYLRREVTELHRRGVRLTFIGLRDRFSPRVQRMMTDAEALTAGNRKLTLVIAVDYGGRWDIARAARQLAEEVAAGRLTPDQVDEQSLGQAISLSSFPPPDLCIRTGGERRISNFLLWQFAYSEFYFCDTYWPDFGEEDLLLAIRDFSARERRFGRTSEQLAQHPTEG